MANDEHDERLRELLRMAKQLASEMGIPIPDEIQARMNQALGDEAPKPRDTNAELRQALDQHEAWEKATDPRLVTHFNDVLIPLSKRADAVRRDIDVLKAQGRALHAELQRQLEGAHEIGKRGPHGHLLGDVTSGFLTCKITGDTYVLGPLKPEYRDQKPCENCGIAHSPRDEHQQESHDPDRTPAGQSSIPGIDLTRLAAEPRPDDDDERRPRRNGGYL